jgi:integrase/recombinase XerC
MQKPFKPVSPRPLPPNAEVVDHEGRPHARLKWKGRSTLFPLTKDGLKYLRPSKCWYFECRDALGTIRRIKGYSDLKATEQLAAESERKASRIRSGYTDPSEEHALRPLVDHLKDYASALEAKADTPGHITKTVGRIRALCQGAGFVFLPDVDVGKASEWLNALRRNGALLELPPGDTFTPGATAKLLGISNVSICAAVRRLNLPASGNGKARTYPRATVDALVMNRTKGCGPATINHYVRAVRGFFRWLVKVKRLGSNPLDTLTLLNAAVDVRHARRELTADELRTLLVGTQASKKARRRFAD